MLSGSQISSDLVKHLGLTLANFTLQIVGECQNFCCDQLVNFGLKGGGGGGGVHENLLTNHQRDSFK